MSYAEYTLRKIEDEGIMPDNGRPLNEEVASRLSLTLHPYI